MELVDTHCHIHFPEYKFKPETVIKSAQQQGVPRLLCVGCTPSDSKLAIKLAAAYRNVWATIGIHPHEAKDYAGKVDKLNKFAVLVKRPKVVAIGECGLDYFYNHSPAAQQIELLKFQIELAKDNDLPLIFHIRDAFEDFWPVFDAYRPLKGVVHSFSATERELEEVLARDLYVGLNGIMTFTKNPAQLAAARAIPLNKLLLETDAPFLTPTPYRGTINEPKYVRVVAEFLAKLRGESLEQLASVTTKNAQKLFGFR
jgi:TatD DNase family protein